MADYNNQNLGTELGWEDEISQESSFVLLPAGEYEFTVDHYVRKRYQGGKNMCACNMAELHLTVDGTTIIDNLYLNSKAEWRLSQFFIGIGQKKKGVPFRPNWNAVPGSRGRLKLGVRTWKGNDGTERQSNEVNEYFEYDPSKLSAPAQTGGWNQPQPNYQQTQMNGYPQPQPTYGAGGNAAWGKGGF